MKMHPRTAAVDRAEVETGQALLAIAEKYNLTPTERLIILNQHIGTMLKYCLRSERHPDEPGRPADEE